MCLRFVFLLISRVAAGLRLSRREEMWKTAEILILRHQLSVAPAENSSVLVGVNAWVRPMLCAMAASGALVRPGNAVAG